MKSIPHNKPSLDNREAEAVKRVLKSGWLVQGKEAEKLEFNMKKLTQTKYAVAVNSGVSALHLSLLALGVGKQDEVILPTYTCTALLNAINYTGAKPVLVDIEKNGFNVDPKRIKNSIEKNTKAIIVPHTFGFPANIDQIKKLGIPVIEDCAQALGSYYKGKPVGSFGDLSIFSFYTTKMIAAGQGGMVMTNNKKYFDAVNDLINYDQRKGYIVRYNYQLTDVAAAIANVQLIKLGSFIKRRRYIASRYQKVLDKKEAINYWPKVNDRESNHYRFILKFAQKSSRDATKKKLKEKGITSIVPIAHYQLLHNYLKLKDRDFVNAEKMALATLSLPIFPALTDEQVNWVSEVLDAILPIA